MPDQGADVGTVDRPVEVELKYRLREEAAGERLLVADWMGSFRGVAGPRSSESEDRYVDTRDGALARAGYAARLRRQRANTTVSVKSLGMAEGALQRRTEMEGPADRTLAPSDWPASPARSFILELCGDAPLVELVTVRQLRRKRRFRDGETIVEVSLDDVEVISRTQLVDRFSELEIELVSGPEAPLLALRDLLDADTALEPSTRSKLETALAAAKGRRPGRGGKRDEASTSAPAPAATGGVRSSRSPRLDGRSPAPADVPAPPVAGTRDHDPVTAPADEATAPQPSETSSAPTPEAPRKKRRHGKKDEEAPPVLVVGRTPGVTSNDVVAEAGRKVLRFHLARLIAREAGTRLGKDPEELHAMRVATRRMRAAWRVFGDGFRPEGTRRYRNRLRDVAQKLGAVRDIDVLVVALEEYRANLAEDERVALEPLLEDWRSQRETGREIMGRELDSAGYRRFVDEYRSFVLTPGAGALVVSPTEPHHVRDTAGSHIWHAYEAVLAYGPVLRWAGVPTLHQLRIAGKWLRYTLEFVGEAIGPGAKPLIERVVAMQDYLGLMNDADVAAARARALLVARAGSLTDAQTHAIARYLTSREREVARLKRGAAVPWRAVASPAFRRTLGRAMATLTAVPTGPNAD